MGKKTLCAWWSPMPVPFVSGVALGRKREHVASIRNPLPCTDHLPQKAVLPRPEPVCLVCLCGEGVRFFTLYPHPWSSREGFYACFILRSWSNSHTCIYKPTGTRLMAGRHPCSGASQGFDHGCLGLGGGKGVTKLICSDGHVPQLHVHLLLLAQGVCVVLGFPSLPSLNSDADMWYRTGLRSLARSCHTLLVWQTAISCVGPKDSLQVWES